MDRRELLTKTGWAFIAGAFPDWSHAWMESLEAISPEGGRADDEDFWRDFRRKYYRLSPDFINLENGYFGVQPQPVLEAYKAHAERINFLSSKYMRQDFYTQDYPKIMEVLADIAGVGQEELLITRNATEALNILIQGIDWNKGDEVILQHHDYHSMVETFQMLAQRRGIRLKFLDIPLKPKSQKEVVDCYVSAMGPSTRCLLLTHLTHLSGQIIPVAEISRIAHQKGIEVIVDAAHSFAQLDYRLPDLEADFIGVNLHKWFANPLGAGLLYVKKQRIQELQPLFGDVRRGKEDIRKLGHYGTPAAPVIMTLAASAAFNQMLSLGRKENRLRYLQRYWTRQADQIERVEVMTPLGKDQSCALGSFKIEGVRASEAVRRLDEDFGVFTVIRRLHKDEVLRVTPNLHNGTQDLDRLLEGIEYIAKKG